MFQPCNLTILEWCKASGFLYCYQACLASERDLLLGFVGCLIFRVWIVKIDLGWVVKLKFLERKKSLLHCKLWYLKRQFLGAARRTKSVYITKFLVHSIPIPYSLPIAFVDCLLTLMIFNWINLGFSLSRIIIFPIYVWPLFC